MNGTDWKPTRTRQVTLRHDSVRGTDLLLLPERVVVLHGAAGEILRLCDGTRDVGEIIAELADRFPDAPVRDEVPAFLHRVRTQGWLA